MRDLRDPEKLGEKLLQEAQHQKRPASACYDNNVMHFHIPDVSSDDSMQRVAQAEYAETLKGLK